MNTKSSIGVLLALVSVGGVYFYSSLGSKAEISSFEECAAAGYPVMESYPRQCNTPGGKHFVEDVAPVGEFWGTIEGMVLLGPTCPVERDPPDPNCADRPYATQLVLTSADGTRVVKEFSSGSDGKFYIEAPPGEYVIRGMVSTTLPYCATTSSFRLLANDSLEVMVSCDSGIR